MNFPRYPKYKASGVDWLGDVPEGWGVKRLRFVAKLNPSKSEVSAIDRGTAVSFLPMEAVGDDGTLVLDKEKTFGELETGYTYFRDGDVTIAKITPCYENGKGAIMRGLTNGIGFGTTELIVARPDTSEITSAYLHYLFISQDFRGLGESHMYGAGGQKRVPDAFVKNFATGIPPLSEQTAIAEFLERETAKIDGLVSEQRRLMELLREKRQAVISHAVTKGISPHAPMKPSGIEWLGDVPEHWNRTRIKRAARAGNKTFVDGDWIETPYITTEGVRLLQCGNVGTGVFEEQGFRYVSEKTFASFDCTEVEPGNVLICRLQSSRTILAGRACLAPSLGVKMITSVDNCIVKPSQDFDPRFIVYQLSTNEYLSFVEVVARGGTRDRVSRSMLGNIDIVAPPVKEQKQIADFIDIELLKFDTLTAEAQRAIDFLQERRTALISAAVTGQFDVRKQNRN